MGFRSFNPKKYKMHKPANKELNLGSMAHSQGKVVCTKAVSMGIKIDVRKVLTDSPENFNEILKKAKLELKMA